MYGCVGIPDVCVGIPDVCGYTGRKKKHYALVTHGIT